MRNDGRTQEKMFNEVRKNSVCSIIQVQFIWHADPGTVVVKDTVTQIYKTLCSAPLDNHITLTPNIEH
jgi:hypothetical protein